MPRELRPLVRALDLRPVHLSGRRSWRGSRFGAEVVAATVGVGPSSARRSVADLLEATDASGVLVIGVAGACAAHLRLADVVNPDTVLDASDGRTYFPHGFLGRPDDPSGGRNGTLVTVDRLGAPVPPGSTAVDMETAAVAAECVARGVPWDVRRAVSDLPGGVPEAVGTLLREDGRADMRAVTRLLRRDPAQAVALARLGRDTARAVSAVTTAALALFDAPR